MITKLLKDHVIIKSPFCGELREVLPGQSIRPTLPLLWISAQRRRTITSGSMKSILSWMASSSSSFMTRRQARSPSKNWLRTNYVSSAKGSITRSRGVSQQPAVRDHGAAL